MYRYSNGGFLMRHLLGVLVLLLALGPAVGVAQDKKKYKILYITQ